MKTLKIIGGIFCSIFALVALFGTLHRPQMAIGILIWGAGAFFLFKSANKN